MGFLDNDNTGVGNTSKPNTLSVSGVSADMMNIHNYNKLTIHVSKGVPASLGAGAIVLTNTGCVYNGQPQWDFEDGFYDGDFETFTHHHHHYHGHEHDGRYGSAVCSGKSHKLRFGGEGSRGSWEFVTHGHITSWTTGDTLNPFAIQGSGDTAGVAGPGMGGWISATGTTHVFPYGNLRLQNVTYPVGGITAITTDGVIY
tara:strand:- start:93 stop:692 length:600 start_codon:yes stop_codon:yes gene_type:complete